jgi:hypothetical protein
VSLRAAADLCGVSASELAELNPALRSGVTPSGYSLRVPAGKAEPLRIGLATYVEPVHARRTIARSTRGGRTGRIARGRGGVVAIAQGKKSAQRVARTAPQRYRRGDRQTVQTARAGSAPVREAKLSTAKRRITGGDVRAKKKSGAPASSAKAKKSAPAKKSTRRS